MRDEGQGVTFDSGVLVALERRKQRAWDVHLRYRQLGALITVPAPVIGEWWRARTDVRERILASIYVEPLTAGVARLAGEALAFIPRATIIDAFVMASAATRGDLVYTSDVDDLERLRAFFPGVRVLRI